MHIGDIAVISRISHVYRVYRVYIAAHFREFTLLTFAFDGQFVEKNLLFQNYFKVKPICRIENTQLNSDCGSILPLNLIIFKI